jgi:hypothetical protein
MHIRSVGLASLVKVVLLAACVVAAFYCYKKGVPNDDYIANIAVGIIMGLFVIASTVVAVMDFQDVRRAKPSTVIDSLWAIRDSLLPSILAIVFLVLIVTVNLPFPMLWFAAFYTLILGPLISRRIKAGPPR